MKYVIARYLLGYIPGDNRLYLGDKELNVVSFQLLLSVLEYQTAVMRRSWSQSLVQLLHYDLAGTLTPPTKFCRQCQRSRGPESPTS